MARQVTGTFDIQGTVLDVAAKAAGRSTKYVVKFSDGKEYDTFDRALAEAIAATKGQQVVLRIEQSQNGKYTNFDVSELNPAPSIGGTVHQAGEQSLISQPAGNGASLITQEAPRKQRDFEAEALGKVRFGAIIAGLEQAVVLSVGESDREIFERATQFAQAIEAYTYGRYPVGSATAAVEIQLEAPAVEEAAPAVADLVEQGVVQVGTSAVQTGLPWGAQS